jgi:hypothetical protein
MANAAITIKLTATEFDNIRALLALRRKQLTDAFQGIAGVNTPEAAQSRAEWARELFRLDALDKAFS